MHSSTTAAVTGESLYALALNADGGVEIQVLPPSPTTALLSLLLEDTELLAGSVLTVYLGLDLEGPATTEEEAAARLHEFARLVWQDAHAHGWLGYLEWAHALASHDEIDWIIITRYIVGVAAFELTPAEAHRHLERVRNHARAAHRDATAGILQ
jgi:hypothetical protein